ncbi:MAG: tetratricopeptide repeat protein [Pseudomonadota bacterium]
MSTPKVVNVQEALEIAGRLHDDGRLDEAEAVYQKALMGEPNNPEALHGLGVLMIQWGQPDQAVPLLNKALASRPDYPLALSHLGCAYQALGQNDQALAAYQQAVVADPAFVEGWNNLAIALAGNGRLSEAEEKLRHAIRLWPEYAKAWDNLGVLLQQQGRLSEALQAYEHSIKLDGGNPESVENFRNALMLAGDAENFVARFEGELKQAVASYEETLTQHPQVAEAHNNLGNALKEQHRYAEAIAHYKLATALRPDYTAPLNNWGVALQEMEQPAEAIPYYEAALATKPDDALVHSNLAAALMELGRIEEALDHLEASVYLNPDYPESRYNLSLALLNLGRLQEGWRHYIYRGSEKQRNNAAPFLERPLPADMSGKRVLLTRNQGIGDELFFLRFAAMLKNRGAWVAYRAADKIAPIARRLPFLDQVVGRHETPPDLDHLFSIGDLPLALGVNDLSQVPLSVSLTPPAEAAQRVDARMALLPPGDEPLIGVTWRAGADKSDPETRKSRLPFKEIPLETLADILRGLPGKVLILQRHPKPGEVEAFAAALGRPVHDFADLNEDLDQMLALMARLDEYVGVSNTNTHLRAAVGRASRVLVPANILDWRWMSEGERSPWFPECRVYRQTPEGSWLGASLLLRDDLQARHQGGGEAHSRPAYSRAHPSPLYGALLALYGRMHAADPEVFAGKSVFFAASPIRDLVERLGARTLLDYGSGKGSQYAPGNISLPGVPGVWPGLKEYWGVESVTCFEPAAGPGAVPPEGQWDGVICVDVLEHCGAEDLPWIVDELFALARRFVFANVASYPAAKLLPNGDNAHVTQRREGWWRSLFAAAAARHPGIQWTLGVDRIVVEKGEKQVREHRVSGS